MGEGILDRLTIVAACEDDLDDVVGLDEAADRSLGVPTDPARDELLWVWHLPTTGLERDTRLVRDGPAIVAYAEATCVRRRYDTFDRGTPEAAAAGSPR